MLTGSDADPIEDYSFLAKSAPKLEMDGLRAARSRFEQWTARRREIITMRFKEWIDGSNKIASWR